MSAVRTAVHGVLAPGFFGTTLPDWLADALDEGLAGVVYFGQNISEDTAGTAALSAQIRAHRPAAIIATDEEGGTVTRLEAVHGSTLPGPAQLGAVDDPELTEKVGSTLAARAAAAGISLVLGPVADVNTNPANPVIGVRAFGADAELVSRHVAAQVRGIQAGGVAACVKHFPGHGDTHSDSHLALPEIDLDPAQITDVHFEPFRAAIAAGVDVVMTAHIRIPAWGDAPATLNRDILDRLRGLGFNGVIMTDALDMSAIRESVGAGPGAVAAILAGADLLCIGNPVTNQGGSGTATADLEDFLEVRDALVAAVESGALPLEQLQRAAARNAALAARLHSAPAPVAVAEPDWASALAETVATVGDTTRSGASATLCDLRARASIAVASESDAFTSALSRDRVLSVIGADDALPASGDLLVLVDRIGVPGAQTQQLTRIAAQRPDALVINVGVIPRDESSGLARIDARAGSALAAELVVRTLAGSR